MPLTIKANLSGKIVLVALASFTVLNVFRQLTTVLPNDNFEFDPVTVPGVPYRKLRLDETTAEGKRSSLQIAHVWAPYVVRDYKLERLKRLFSPLDQAQNLTWESISRAQTFYQINYSDNIQVICAVLWMDYDILTSHKPSLCRPENTVVLNRSSHTEYSSLQPPIHFPFVQDILTAPTNYDYLVLSNPDIVLTEKFYVNVRQTIDRFDYDAFVINRRVIRQKRYLNETISSAHLTVIEKELLPNGKKHPGVDCFVMRHDVVKPVNLGMMFAGHPPWGGALLRYLMIAGTRNFKIFGSEYGWTFHIGRDEDWNHEQEQRAKISGETKRLLEQCVLMDRERVRRAGLLPPHWFQNVKNCANASRDLSCWIDKNQSKLLQTYYSADVTSMREYHVTNETWQHIAPLVPRSRRAGDIVPSCFNLPRV